MPGDSGAIEKLPNELLLHILRHVYPPAAFQPFDLKSVRAEDSVWHESLLDAHLDIVSVSKVSRSFHALSVILAQSHAVLVTEEREDGLLLHAMSERGLALAEEVGLLRILEQQCGRRNWGSCKTWGSGISFTQVFRAVTRAVTSELAAKEKAEPFDAVSWLDIGYNHTRRAARCSKIVLGWQSGFRRFMEDGHVARFGFVEDEWFLRWRTVIKLREPLPPQILAMTV
ncbi:MAG: hypothetical protein ASARMPRED_001783 [Alectoria sarmentosa]|nr:MAG: hypothetical protein ASARMPRED_001783 [Alectoria sarmentosa]